MLFLRRIHLIDFEIVRAAVRACAAAPGAIAMGFDFVAADELFAAAVAADAVERVWVLRLAVPRAKV